MNVYDGFTYPSIFYRWPFRWFWKKYMCPQNKHLLDEVWSDSNWYLSCDVCNLEIHISKINKEYYDEP